MDWNSVDDLLKAMDSIEYVFLRNWDSIREACEEGEDWDVLCLDKEAMVNITHAIPLNQHTDCYNFYTSVGGKKLLLDIRCVGDGYYDKPWEEVMIKNRVKTEGIYVLCKEDYNYSILYHALLQKRERDGAKYNQMLRELFDESNKEKWIGNLAQFLIKKEYQLVLPLDEGVYINRRLYNQLGEMMNGREN
ncbi:MAG: hypothetical protein HFI54_09535 [Lachnospiraceae bacterium]|nr:hypothetical protein [Lachnospiraceae bacterium]